MKLRGKIVLLVMAAWLAGLTFWCVWLQYRKVYPGMPAQLKKTYYKPAAIMGINFGENVSADFKPGQHYCLQVFYVKGGEVGFGFSRIDTEGPAK